MVAHYSLGYAFEQLGEVAQARNAYQTVLRLQPNHTEAQQRLAALERKKGKGERGKEDKSNSSPD